MFGSDGEGRVGGSDMNLLHSVCTADPALNKGRNMSLGMEISGHPTLSIKHWYWQKFILAVDSIQISMLCRISYSTLDFPSQVQVSLPPQPLFTLPYISDTSDVRSPSWLYICTKTQGFCMKHWSVQKSSTYKPNCEWICTEAQFLFLITHIFKAVIAIGFETRHDYSSIIVLLHSL